jgi:F-type H+-transporting ATPase subunit b
MPNLFAMLRPSRWLGAAVVVSTWAIALPALAEAGGEGAHSGLPQLDPSSFAKQIFWLAIAFAVLYWLLTRRALPVVESVLETRQQRIAADLDAAAKAKDEATAAQAKLEKALAEARATAQDHVAGIMAKADADARERQARLGGDIAARVATAERQVAAAKAEAVANVRVAAADIACDIIHKLAGLSADSARAESVVATIIRERG